MTFVRSSGNERGAWMCMAPRQRAAWRVCAGLPNQGLCPDRRGSVLPKAKTWLAIRACQGVLGAQLGQVDVRCQACGKPWEWLLSMLTYHEILNSWQVRAVYSGLHSNWWAFVYLCSATYQAVCIAFLLHDRLAMAPTVALDSRKLLANLSRQQTLAVKKWTITYQQVIDIKECLDIPLGGQWSPEHPHFQAVAQFMNFVTTTRHLMTLNAWW